VSLHLVATFLVYCICESFASVFILILPISPASLSCSYLKISLALPIFRSVGMVPPPPPPPPSFHERQRMLCCGAHSLNNLYQYKWIDSAAMDKLASSLAAADREEQSQEKGWWAGVAAAASSSVYKSLIPGLGSYDVSVLVEALKQKKAKFAMHLLGNKKLDEDLSVLGAWLLKGGKEGGRERREGRIKGIILNRMSRNVAMRWLLDGRHWLALIPRHSSSSSSFSSAAAAATATAATTAAAARVAATSIATTASSKEDKVVIWWDVDSKLPVPVLVGGVPELLVYLRKNILEEGGQAFVIAEGEEEGQAK